MINRSEFIGGSDTAAILGVSPWKSPLMLYKEKIGEHVKEVTPAKQKIFNRGKRWEPVVVEMLIDELKDRGHDVRVIDRNNRFSDLEHEFLAAEIDLELLVDGETVNGEMKTVHPFAAKDWGEQDTDEIPIYYTAQILHGQMVTRRNKTIVAALIGADDLRVHTVDRDDEMINVIRAKELEFWERVQNRQAPEPVSIEDIKLMYAKDSGSIIDASFEILNLCEAAKIIKQNIKIQETNLTEILTEIKLGMSDSSVLIHNGKQLATWRANKDSMKTDWQAAFHDLVGKTTGLGQADIDQIIKSATTTKPGARPFLLKG